jgi:signal transduction histidine kinase
MGDPEPTDADVLSTLAETQRQLDIARERLRQAMNAQRRLMSDFSHEMKTPIAVLLTESQTLDTDGLPPDARAFVRSVRHEMRLLGATIEAFTLLSRLPDDAEIPDRRPCDLNDLLLDAIGSCAATANRLGVVMRINAATDPTPPAIAGNSHLLRSLIGHVLRCSIRASPPGGEVAITASTHEDHGRISVLDRGRHIAPTALPTLFDRLVGTPAGHDDRRELGLSIARTIAELHRGRLTARNLPEPGCEFLIELPLAPPRPVESSTASAGDAEGIPLA